MHSSADLSLTIEVAARSSPLSQAQVREIYDALKCHHPGIHFDIHYMTTIGDQDKTSLRIVNTPDFFTREIDHWVLEGYNRVGIHSAKDLPVPLSEGLSIFCLTQGLDSSDSLVLRPDQNMQNLAPGSLIATSSIRREEMVKELRNDVEFCDVRGTIEQRLSKLTKGEVDGVIVAEAALIRLGLTHLNRIRLPGATVDGQGRLAVVGRKQDRKLQKIFSVLDARAEHG